ncbi:hypothetical protein [Prosthecobacter sp.]|uniref:hypothetical protein n=1 Tax=Prosthecobacter sp. TaxID=1965333 RepID=UPI0037849A81
MNTPDDGNDEEEDLNQGLEPPRPRIDARPKNNLYAPGTGPGTGRTAIRVGTMNRDGTKSALSPLGAATGPLAQRLPGLTAGATGPVKRADLQPQGGPANGNGNNGAGGLNDEPARLDMRPKNNLYAPGTGPGTGRTAIRVGTMNRDGTKSALSPLGAATGPLAQRLPGLTAGATGPVTRADLQAQGTNANGSVNSAGGGVDGEPKRLDTRPKNNLYAPGTGPGTGRTAIRVGTMNRDGTRSALSPLGAATGPLTQKLPGLTDDAAPPVPRLLRPRPMPGGFAQQRASENARAVVCERRRCGEGTLASISGEAGLTKRGGRGLHEGHEPKEVRGLNAGLDLNGKGECGLRIEGSDGRFAAAARAALVEEAAESPVAAALQRAAARLNVSIQLKRKGLAETLTDRAGHTTIYYNPFARTGATMSHELAHAIQQAAFHEVIQAVEKSGRKAEAKDIERAIKAGRDALDRVVPVKCGKDRGDDYKENEAMRVSRIVNAERAATRMKGLPKEKRTAREFWRQQGPQEMDRQHQDNERPLPRGTEHGRYEHRYVKGVLGRGGDF